ncbi:SusC/RagA family TonB-linked outer membrane protein [Sphingobacterium sp. 1.A.4]|uniref:SusC/RagA family TonB-linked outer membrane protein n=1 Tax=Sphingobacterium sp. 1.A.4 TaxID=2044603 RepID=UPI000C0BDD59|nr:SusC/RagA family TonB-linked outer membrane protein [Sphingobacterium sp. 1.A.4]
MNRSILRISQGSLILLLGLSCISQASGHVKYVPLKSYAAQELINVRITVLDQSSGNPLEGVSISANNRAIGLTGKDGVFSGSVVKGTTLSLRMIGYNSTTVKVDQETYSIKLSAVDESIEEVVVTALGIKRDEQALGYSATSVKGEQLTEALSNNWMDALSGKVAGVNLMRSNAGPVGTTKIILRGENNLTGENGALIVVDGVIMNGGSGRSSALGSDGAYGTGSDNMPVDYGNGMDDINPEDIESITVLKGPGAAALYGSRGANGAVIITTKSGSAKGKGIGITVNSNAAFESMNRSPDLQYEYGQGLDGAAHYSFGSSVDGSSTSGTSSAYGPKFDGQEFFQYDPILQKVGPTRTPWRAYDGKNGVNGFFDVGRTFTNTVSIDGSTDKTTARFSATNTHNKWIVPNTGYKKNSLALSVSSKITDKLTINSKVNYTNRWSDNLPGTGYGNQSLMYWYIFWQPSADLNWLRNYWVNGEEDRKIAYPFSTYPENPYAISYEFINSNNRHTITGNAQAVYQFSKDLKAHVRAAMDMGIEDRNQNRPYDAGSKLREGSYRSQSIFSKETNIDFLVTYNKKLNDDFDFSVNLGGASARIDYDRDEMTSDGLFYPGVYNHNNSKYGVKTRQIIERSQTNSLYALVTTGYKDFLFLDATFRRDWASTLATRLYTDKELGFNYPSINGSFVFSKIWDLPEFISFGKFRASYAGTGSGVQKPFQTEFNYENPNSLLGGSLANPSTLANPLIKPLSTSSLEFGTDIRMFNNKVKLDIAWYKANSSNQHLYRFVDPASGVSRFLVNFGEVENKGLEIALNTDQIKAKDNGFGWSSYITYTGNKNLIKQLTDSTIVLQQRSVGSGQIVGMVGGSLGDLYGIGYERAPDGQVIYDESTGYAKLTSEILYLGNTIPKGKMSFGNNFSYKGLRMNLLFDTQWGAVGHSLTHYKLAEQGKTKNTLPGRYSSIIGNGVIQNADGTYRQNDVIAKNVDEYYRSHFGQDNAEGSTFPTDFIKFREARLDYSLNKNLVSRLGINRATIGVYGRDLFIWTKWPAFDPEFGTLDGGDIVKGFEIAQFPSTRTFGFNLIVGF